LAYNYFQIIVTILIFFLVIKNKNMKVAQPYILHQHDNDTSGNTSSEEGFNDDKNPETQISGGDNEEGFPSVQGQKERQKKNNNLPDNEKNGSDVIDEKLKVDDKQHLTTKKEGSKEFLEYADANKNKEGL
jgi:hypothetical protein